MSTDRASIPPFTYISLFGLCVFQVHEEWSTHFATRASREFRARVYISNLLQQDPSDDQVVTALTKKNTFALSKEDVTEAWGRGHAVRVCSDLVCTCM